MATKKRNVPPLPETENEYGSLGVCCSPAKSASQSFAAGALGGCDLVIGFAETTKIGEAYELLAKHGDGAFARWITERCGFQVKGSRIYLQVGAIADWDDDSKRPAKLRSGKK